MKLNREYRGSAPMCASPMLTAALAISLAAFSACVKDASGPQDEAAEVEGTYALAEVGGNPLPATIYEGPWTSGGERIQVRIDMTNSTLELDEDGHYDLQMQVRISTGGKSGAAPLSDSGTYTRDGDTVTFRSDRPSATVFSGRLRGGALQIQMDIVGDGHPPVYEYRK